ncbi:bifunctional uridylate/adenylate kinase [Spiromyces aspiralis]|uniref:Bifunctional uridylate/adenylate kinase n=1 Tax=Spiromyces aspiralis TaxID=68401 RepID=A0ACC1HEA9_9FUNG|nr:bifunctional uridylate/adenylate kinase [Spiromyces aspiralis]
MNGRIVQGLLLRSKRQPISASRRVVAIAHQRATPVRHIQYSSKKYNEESGGDSKSDSAKASDSRKGPTAPAVFAVASIIIAAYYSLVRPRLKERQQQQPEQQGEKLVEDVNKPNDDEAAKSFPFHKKTVVFVLGGPGSGKGTNSAKLVEDFGFVHLSAGDLLRAEQQRPGSKYGELIAHYIREGMIVPHEITIKLLRNAMMAHPESDRFLIDGFPRNLVQAKAFEDTVTRCKKVLYYECPESIMLERLLKRGEISGRSDDNLESIRKRFRVFHNESYPVIEEFSKQGKVISVSCQASPEAVYADTKMKVTKIFSPK